MYSQNISHNFIAKIIMTTVLTNTNRSRIGILIWLSIIHFNHKSVNEAVEMVLRDGGHSDVWSCSLKLFVNLKQLWSLTALSASESASASALLQTSSISASMVELKLIQWYIMISNISTSATIFILVTSLSRMPSTLRPLISSSWWLIRSPPLLIEALFNKN